MKFKLNRLPHNLFRLLAFAMALTLLSGCFACSKRMNEKETHYGVFLGVNTEQISLLKGYDTVVIDAAYFSKEDVESIRKNGAKKVYSYLNIGSIEDFREGYDALKDCVLAAYDNWPGEFWVDVSRPEWQTFIEQSAKTLAEKDVDGFFLDNADVYYLYPTQDIFDGLVSIITMLSSFDKDILINGGDVFVSNAILNQDSPQIQINGVNQECVFTNINFANNSLILQDADTSRYYQDYLTACKAKGLEVYLLEYANDGAEVEETILAYCRQQGYQYYCSPSKDLVG